MSTKTPLDISGPLLAALLFILANLMSPAARAQTQDAQFIPGNYTILPDGTGAAATMQLAGVQDEQTNSGAHSGSLGFELWYLPAPFSGGGAPVTGYKVAAAYLPIANCTKSDLNAGEICSGITVQSNLTLPAAGTYYPVLFLVEHTPGCTTNNGFCYIDHVQLMNLSTGGPTVTVSSGGGGGGASTGNVTFSGSSTIQSLNWQSQLADLAIPAIQNHANATSGTVAVGLWLQSTPYNGSSLDSGYRVVFYKLPATCTTGNAQLSANSGCTAFDTGSIALTPVPAGTYYPILLLLEYCGASSGDGYCIDDKQTFQSPVTVSYPSGGGSVGSPGGGSGGISFVGSQAAKFDFSGGAVDLTIGGVSNSTANTTGSIEVEVWFTTTPYAGNGGFTGSKVASYRLPAGCTVGYNQLPANSACSSFDTGSINASYPSPGTYYAILAIDEYSSTNSACASNGGFCLASATQLDQQVTVPQPTSVVPPPLDGGGNSGGGGGGGSLDVVTLAGLLVFGATGFVQRRRDSSRRLAEMARDSSRSLRP